MLLFGHIGITLGIAVLLSRMLPNDIQIMVNGSTLSTDNSTDFTSTKQRPTRRPSWLSLLWNRLDMRVILIGSLVPDIIDKPIGLLFFRETLSNGRIIGHSLLFLILVTLAGLYLYRSRGTTTLLGVSFGVFTHIIFDQMWETPRTLFWPIYGVTFGRESTADWIPNIFHGLTTDPCVYLPELVGAAILVWFILVLVRKRKVFSFLKRGQVQ